MLNPRRADRHDLAARLLSSTVRMRGLSASQTPDFMHNLSEWLVRYGTWLMDATGIGRYENLQLIYNHLITFRDPQTLAPVSHWEHLFLQAQRAGFVASLRISVEVACCNCDKLLVLLKSGLVKGVTLVQEQARVPHGLQTGDVTNLVTQLQSYTALSFVGSYDFWRAVVLCDAVMDHRCFTISPISDRQARRRNCLGAVGCHVMEDGAVYVCAGLEGVKQAWLGSIYLPGDFNPLRRKLVRELPDWIRHGPEGCAGLSSGQRAAGKMCEL
jgi:hypothetical protein